MAFARPSSAEIEEAAAPERAVLLEMYRRALAIRRFEETCASLHQRGEMPGAVHTSIGQEGVAVGMSILLRPDDYMAGNHRSHAHLIAKGAALGPLMAELFGRRTGVCKGKGGSMHLADASVGSIGESGIVASSIPVAAGAALAAQVKGTDQVALAWFGEGAANEGVFHESLNLAATWRLPVIFACENNGYAVTVPQSRSTSIEDIASRAAGFAIPAAVVDGQDAVAVYRVTSTAIERARRGGGPSLIEAKTYRFRAHLEGLPVSEGRPPEEEAAWAARDPLTILASHLLNRGFTSQELEGVEIEADVLVADAMTFARESPWPALEETFEDLYASPVPVSAL